MKKIVCTLAIAAALAGCSKQETPKAAAAPEQTKAAPVNAASAAAPTAQMPPGHPAVAPGATGGSIGENLAPAAQAKLTGTVTETMNSGGYTYIRMKNSDGEQWAAVQQTAVKKGQTVTILTQMTADNFESSSLGRKFDRIVFGTIADPGATQPAAPATAAMMAGAAEHMKAKAAAIGDVKVPKAEGTNAKTVAEVWAGRPAIKGTSVIVRAKVVKFLPEIMGKNWMHVRDGSGSAEKGDHDLTVTTSDVAKVGDVVVVSGKVSVDKDFGAGYSYAVILEDARVTK